MLTGAIFIRALLSWFPIDPRNPLVTLLYDVTEPILDPLRRVIPRLGMIDITPLVAKLRENRRFVIGMSLKESASNLLVEACDEFIFIEDLEQKETSPAPLDKLPKGKQKIFQLLLTTVGALLREGRGALYGSLVKDTMKRKQPSFNELGYGYTTFGDLLEDAAELGLIELTRDKNAGGTYVVTGLGPRARIG